MAYQRGNQRDGSPSYVFLYPDDEISGDEDIPLHTRMHSTSLPVKIEVINVQLKPEDTLQALALRYRCTISELKRINKIHKENEIFARRFIKVPVKPFSVLTETLDHTQSINQDTSKETITNEDVTNPLRVEHVNSTCPSSIIEPQHTEINTIILNSVCEPLSSFNSVSTPEICYTECDQLLSPTESNIVESHVTETFKCSGDDCGLSWTQLLGFSLLLGFAGPIIYILYIAEYSSKNHPNLNH